MIDFKAFEIADAISVLFYCFWGYFLCFRLLKYGSFFFYFFLILSIEHLIATILYLPSGQDSARYFQAAYNYTFSWQGPPIGQAGVFIHFLTYLLINFLKLSYTGCFFFYSVFG